MIDIRSYMNDGANYQAQAVLALLRYKTHSLMHGIGEELPAEIEVGRWENCREQGYVFRINIGLGRRVKNYCVYEHRNSDNICVQMFEGFTLNTPSIDMVFDNGKKTKWDIDKQFSVDEVVACADFIVEDMTSVYNEEHQKVMDKKKSE